MTATILVHDIVATGTPTRWVMVLHGLGDSKEGWKPVADYLALPSAKSSAVVRACATY